MKKLLLIALALVATGSLIFLYHQREVDIKDRAAREDIVKRKENARIDDAINLKLYLSLFGKCGYVRLQGENIQGIRPTIIRVFVNDDFEQCIHDSDYIANLKIFCESLNLRKGDKFIVLKSKDEAVLISYDLERGFRLSSASQAGKQG